MFLKKSIREISHVYNASVSSIYNIVKRMHSRNNDDSLSSKNCIDSIKLNKEEKLMIKEFIRPPQIPLTIKSINDEISKCFGEKDRRRYIKEYLKKSLKYSYKKGGATTFKGGSERTKYLQSIFSSKILNEIMSDKLINSVDEWVF